MGSRSDRPRGSRCLGRADGLGVITPPFARPCLPCLEVFVFRFFFNLGEALLVRLAGLLLLRRSRQRVRGVVRVDLLKPPLVIVNAVILFSLPSAVRFVERHVRQVARVVAAVIAEPPVAVGSLCAAKPQRRRQGDEQLASDFLARSARSRQGAGTAERGRLVLRAFWKSKGQPRT